MQESKKAIMPNQIAKKIPKKKTTDVTVKELKISLYESEFMRVSEMILKGNRNPALHKRMSLLIRLINIEENK